MALLVAGSIASVGVLGSHFAGDFFLGIDIMVTSMMVNFLLMCITLLSIRKVNPALAQNIAVLKNRKLQLVIGWLGVITLLSFLSIHLYKDLTAQTEAWYFHSTPIWLIVMAMASLVFGYKWRKLTQRKTNLSKQFLELPEE
jgi:hypothetical protein